MNYKLYIPGDGLIGEDFDWKFSDWKDDMTLQVRTRQPKFSIFDIELKYVQ